ncbi:MAG: ABC transporter permease [Polaribacter sp.]|nr:ABC transporter permease [Polaribacter sp.]MDG1811899.1 ABC transporter permease [Polaribacter sp.]MDG1993300.1 ABC transporter permease [Polaribacter sp.]
MNFPFYIAKRYLFAKSGNNTINIITIIASFGVIIGSLALFIILSGFSGFTTFTDGMLEYSDPDIKITAAKGKSFVVSDSITSLLLNNKDIKAFASVVEERAFLQYKQRELIAFVKGVSDNYMSITSIDSTLHNGQWLDSNFINTAVIGFGISDKLSLSILNFGEPLEIKVPKAGKGLILNASSAFNAADVQISGVYTGLEDFANKYVYVNLRLAQQLLNYKANEVTAVEIRVEENIDHTDFAKALQNDLGNDFKVETKAQFNAITYKVLNTERLISYLIFTLIIIIALFNVIGAIIMMIIDKKQNLKTLFNLGVSIKEIKRIFVLQGFLLTLFGLFIGLTIGTILVLLQKKFSFFMITQSIPYPVEFRFINLLIVAITISILGFIASKIASSRISANFIEK